MKVEQLMTRNVESCRPSDCLNRPAQVMWEHDCGIVPVVSDGDGSGRVVGMLTDRDICMAAYTQGRPLQEIPVASAMAQDICSCRPSDAIAVALKVMETNQIRRLPVVDQDDRLVGIISLADIAREAQHEHGVKRAEISDLAIAKALETISASRSSTAVIAA
jgi:CBS domain-containing protein